MNRIVIALGLIFLLIGCNNYKPDRSKLNLDVTKAEFVLTECNITYKGKPIPLGKPLEEWVKVFGEYDRNFGNRNYIWDSLCIGIENGHILSRDKNVPDSLRKHDKFMIFFSNLKSPMGKQGELKFARYIYEINEKELMSIDPENPKTKPYTKKDIKRLKKERHYSNFIYPLKTYDKVISVEGVPIQKGFLLEDINYYRERKNLEPFYKHNAESKKDYMVGDNGYYYNNAFVWEWYRDKLPDPKKCKYFIKAYYTNYELEFIEIEIVDNK